MAEKTERVQPQEPEWVVWLTLAIALIIGFALQYSVVGRTRDVAIGNSTVAYPAGWAQVSRNSSGFTAADLGTGGPFAARVSLLQLDRTVLLPGGGGLYNAAVNWSIKNRDKLTGYRLLEIKNIKVRNRDAIQLESAFLMELGTHQMPGLMRSVDTLVLNGNTFDILSFASEQSQFDRLAPLRKQLLKSWNFKQTK